MKSVAKAITAALATFGTAFTGAIMDDHVTNNEWVLIAVATAIAGLAVYTVPNTPTQ